MATHDPFTHDCTYVRGTTETASARPTGTPRWLWPLLALAALLLGFWLLRGMHRAAAPIPRIEERPTPVEPARPVEPAHPTPYGTPTR